MAAFRLVAQAVDAGVLEFGAARQDLVQQASPSAGVREPGQGTQPRIAREDVHDARAILEHHQPGPLASVSQYRFARLRQPPPTPTRVCGCRHVQLPPLHTLEPIADEAARGGAILQVCHPRRLEIERRQRLPEADHERVGVEQRGESRQSGVEADQFGIGMRQHGSTPRTYSCCARHRRRGIQTRHFGPAGEVSAQGQIATRARATTPGIQAAWMRGTRPRASDGMRVCSRPKMRLSQRQPPVKSLGHFQRRRASAMPPRVSLAGLWIWRGG